MDIEPDALGNPSVSGVRIEKRGPESKEHYRMKARVVELLRSEWNIPRSCISTEENLPAGYSGVADVMVTPSGNNYKGRFIVECENGPKLKWRPNKASKNAPKLGFEVLYFFEGSLYWFVSRSHAVEIERVEQVYGGGISK